MDARDWLILKEIMEYFNSFDELKQKVGKSLGQTHAHLRNPNMAMKVYPNGSIGDWYIAILNCWNDYVIDVLHSESFPAALPVDIMLARMAEEMNCTVSTAKKRLDTLKQGKYLIVEYGMIHFPKENLQNYEG